MIRADKFGDLGPDQPKAVDNKHKVVVEAFNYIKPCVVDYASGKAYNTIRDMKEAFKLQLRKDKLYNIPTAAAKAKAHAKDDTPKTPTPESKPQKRKRVSFEQDERDSIAHEGQSGGANSPCADGPATKRPAAAASKRPAIRKPKQDKNATASPLQTQEAPTAASARGRISPEEGGMDFMNKSVDWDVMGMSYDQLATEGPLRFEPLGGSQQ